MSVSWHFIPQEKQGFLFDSITQLIFGEETQKVGSRRAAGRPQQRPRQDQGGAEPLPVPFGPAALTSCAMFEMGIKRGQEGINLKAKVTGLAGELDMKCERKRMTASYLA